MNNMPDPNGQCLMVLDAFMFLSIIGAMECTSALTFPLTAASKLTRTSTNYCPLVGLFMGK